MEDFTLKMHEMFIDALNKTNTVSQEEPEVQKWENRNLKLRMNNVGFVPVVVSVHALRHGEMDNTWI